MVRPVPAEHRDVPDVAIRPAATVMLLRDSAAGPEVFVLRRVAEMVFAPGMTVFPGGAVDPADHHSVSGWVGPDPAWWATRLGCGADDARSLVVAAVRELFEETGVLLATAAASAQGIVLTEADRLAVLNRDITLAAALAAADLRLRADLLRPWANWITPEGHPRRYDTFFFAAELPARQRARQLTSEADLAQWRRPLALLAEHRAGELSLMPPTLAMLGDLAKFSTVADLMASERTVTPILGRSPAAAQALAAVHAGLQQRHGGIS